MGGNRQLQLRKSAQNSGGGKHLRKNSTSRCSTPTSPRATSCKLQSCGRIRMARLTGTHLVQLQNVWKTSCRVESNQGRYPPAREPPHRLLTAQESGAHAPDGSHLEKEGGGSDKIGALFHPPPSPTAAEVGEFGHQAPLRKHGWRRPGPPERHWTPQPAP